MDAAEIKAKILEQAARNGIEISEEELNAKVLEASKMDSDVMDNLSGGVDRAAGFDFLDNLFD